MQCMIILADQQPKKAAALYFLLLNSLFLNPKFLILHLLLQKEQPGEVAQMVRAQDS